VKRVLLVLAFASAGTAAYAADPARGEKLYDDCIACHSLEPEAHGIGPSLRGIFNRKAGEIAGYRYSPALKRSGVIWTADTLDAFVADCQQFLPGNRMPYAGMPDARDRADLIAYLQKAAK
jgi:cytochrome c